MRWSQPKHWDNRYKSGFLLWPKCIDGECRWLESAVWQEKYEKHSSPGWSAYRWAHKSDLNIHSE